MIGGPPPEIVHTYAHLRPGIFPAANNTSANALRAIGTYTALMVPKIAMVQDNAGAPILTVDSEMYFMPGTPIRVNDQLLDQGDGTRWRVVKVFVYPKKTVVWAARDES